MSVAQFDEVGYWREVSRMRAQFEEQYLPALLRFMEIAYLELPDDEQTEFSTLEFPDSHPNDGREPRFRFITYGDSVSELAYRFGTYLPLQETEGPNKGRFNNGVVRRHVNIEFLPFHKAFSLSAFVFEDRGGLGYADRHGLVYVMPLVRVGDELILAEESFERLIAHFWRFAIKTTRTNLVKSGLDWKVEVPVELT